MRELDALRTKIQSGIASDQDKIDFSGAAGRGRESSAKQILHEMLHDHSAEVRYYALQALVLSSIDRSSQMEEICWSLLLDHDESSRVRGLAAACIGSLRSGSKDASVFARLKACVANAADRFESESVLEALYSVVGRPPREWPATRRVLAGRFSENPPDISVQLREANDLESRFLTQGGGDSDA